MSEIGRNPEDLTAARALIGALCDDRLTAEQAAELEDLVRHSSEIRRLYIRLMHLHAGLYQHASLLGERAIDLDAEGPSPAGLGDTMVLPALRPDPPHESPVVALPRPVERPPETSWRMPRITTGRLRRPVWVAAAAVVLAFGAAVVLLHHGPTGPNPAWPAAGPVATLNQSIGAEWVDGSALAPGAALPANREYGLQSGFARIAFPRGVVVVIEGPARFTVRSKGEIALASGKLSAVVPGEAKGFTVRTPAATVVDLGTEFGVGVSGSGAATDVQVYRGRVSLAPVAASAGPATTGPAAPAGQVIGQGNARRVDATGTVSTIAVVPSAFVRAAQFDGWARGAPAASPLQRWRAYGERLSRDPGLVLYYAFERHADAPDRLKNQGFSGSAGLDLQLGANAPTWAHGRWPDKDALAFDASRHQRLLLSDFPITPNGTLSVTAWVYLRNRTSWASIVKNRGSKKGGQFALGLWGDDGDLVARVFCDDGSEVEVREGKSAPLPTHRWVHVAMVADGSALRLFQNGKEVASRVCRPLSPSPAVRSLAVGFRTDDDGTTPLPSANAENWDGSFDELAVFHRALTSAQLKEMYEAGKP